MSTAANQSIAAPASRPESGWAYRLYSAALALGLAVFFAAGFFAAVFLAAALRAVGLASVALASVDLLGAFFFGAALRFGGALPDFSARASIRLIASSRVMVSGVLSPGRVALMPSTLT